MDYDITKCTWFNCTIHKSITGTKTLVLICSEQPDALNFIEALKQGKYRIVSGITSKPSYKIGLYLNENFTGIEIPKSHHQYNEFKSLAEGKITQITTAYYQDNKQLFVYNPVKMISGRAN